jgi:putative PIG3 family NAD(P)H quinone oxidoreductase
LEVRELPDPKPGSSEVLIDVVAAGVNRADLLQRAGKYPPPPGASEVLGLEVSGTVSGVGALVTDLPIGTPVMALLSGGGYASRVVVDRGSVMRIPAGISVRDGAAIPEVFITAYTNLFVEGRLRQGEAVLVHGGGSGVGTAAIALAKAAGARIAITAGSDEKAKRCREQLGADLSINYRSENFVDRVAEWTEGNGVDVVIDIVGEKYFPQNIEVLKTGGRLVVLSTLSGVNGVLRLDRLMRRRLTVIGSVLRTRSLEEKTALVSSFAERFGSMLSTGALAPVIDSVFEWSDVERAHERIREYQNFGKILLTGSWG